MSEVSRLAKGFWLVTRMDKPIGIYLLLWPTLWALVLASLGLPELDVFLVFALGVMVMRAAGCVINDIADRKVDGHVSRTNQRPLVSGLISTKEALGMFIGLLVIALVLVLQLNLQTFYLSLVALVLASTYPFMKRYTQLPQVVLGAAFSMAIPMASMAVNQHVPLWVWQLFVANLCWTVAYDTQYAMVDRADDLKVGIKSTAILFGERDTLYIGLLQIITLVLVLAVGIDLHLGWGFYVALVLATGQFAWHQWLIKEREEAQCFRAFKANHWVGFTLLLGFYFGLFS
ncbi:MAG: 4-hydroxybenzoate octaprenyltransferase [Glaciecola sp.]|jgi:4-hydroxybenzoate polyprenyltransferase